MKVFRIFSKSFCIYVVVSCVCVLYSPKSECALKKASKKERRKNKYNEIVILHHKEKFDLFLLEENNNNNKTTTIENLKMFPPLYTVLVFCIQDTIHI